MSIIHTSGTVSVTAGSAVVTGTGTGWQTALIAGGIFGLDSANGNPVPILSVESDTQLTLAKPWRGTTAANQGYWLVRDTAYLRQISANADALAAYIARLDKATLQALAALVPAADKLPFFTGAGAAGLADFKASARALLALAAAADKLPYFTGAGTAGLADFKAKGRDVASADTMLSLLSKLGPAFGGVAPVPSAAGVDLVDGDFNTIIVPGVYTIAGSIWANGPPPGPAYTGVMEVYARSFNNGYWQILRLGAATWMRYTSTGTTAIWPTPWMRIANETVGTVSQSAGVPTGAIIERGSNANGEYVRFADGTQLCWSPSFSIDITLAAGALYRATPSTDGAVVWNFPAAFVGNAFPMPAGQNNSASHWISVRAMGAGSAGINAWSVSSTTGRTISAVAIGRWF